MPRLILHIGTGKTGTTSIQMALRKNQSALAEQGFHVIECRRVLPHSSRHMFAWNDPADAGWAELAAEMKQVAPTGRDVILSNEGLWRLDEDEIAHLASAFPGYQPFVLMYVRDQADWIQSSLLQKQKKGRTAFDINNPRKVSRWTARRNLDYLKVCKRFEAVLGQGVMHARLFNRPSFIDGDLLQDFFKTIGVQDTQALDLELGEANPSIAAEFASILSRNRRGEAGSKVRDQHLHDLACRLTANGVGSRYFMTEDEVKAMRAQFSASNAEFARDYMRNATGFVDKKVWISSETATLETIEKQMQEVVARLHLLGVRGWTGQQRSAERLFAKGWTFNERLDGQGVTAALSEPQATICLRMPYRRRFRHKNGVKLGLQTVDGQNLPLKVNVNGLDLGIVNFPAECVQFPLELCEPIDEVTLTLEAVAPLESLPEVCGIVPISLQVAGATDDDLDDDPADEPD